MNATFQSYLSTTLFDWIQCYTVASVWQNNSWLSRDPVGIAWNFHSDPTRSGPVVRLMLDYDLVLCDYVAALKMSSLDEQFPAG